MLKTRKSRIIPLNQKAQSVLLSMNRESKYVFPGRGGGHVSGSLISNHFKKADRKAVLSEQVHFHTLRHTGATWLVQSNVPISYVKEILGHSSVTTTMIYAHNTTDHLRDSLFRLDAFLDN